MSERNKLLVKRLSEAVLAGPGVVEAEVRKAVEAFAEACGDRAGTPAEDIPPMLKPYVEKVARYAYKVTDEDIQALQQAGYAEDAIFEITVSAALGAGMARLEQGLAALRGGE